MIGIIIILDETSSERAGMHALGFHGKDYFWYRVVTVVFKITELKNSF